MDQDITGSMTRRTLLKRTGGAAAAGAVGTAATSTASAQSDLYGGYLSETSNFAGTTADATGMDTVTVAVGAGNGGLLFDPAALLVEPGTTVQFEWTGNGGAHNVYHDTEVSDAEESLFDSGEPANDSGVLYEFTFESGNSGMYPYACSPHRALGMRGVIAVGEDNVQGDTVPFGAEEESLNSVAIFGGAAVFGTTALLGLSAYREMFSEDDH